MRFKSFEHQMGYNFILIFENGEAQEVDLENLIGQHVALAEVVTAQLNAEWGCLEFKAGMVDIEPKTLYKYATQNILGSRTDNSHLQTVRPNF